MSMEVIGNYNVTQIGKDKYAVSLNNGNLGAYVTDKDGVEELRFKEQLKEDKVEFSHKKEAEAPKKKGSAGKALASAFLPGLGQMFDGRTKDGIKDMAAHVGLPTLATVVTYLGVANFAKAVEAGAKSGVTKTPYGFYAAVGVAALAGLGTVANWVHSVVDAYKGGKNS